MLAERLSQGLHTHELTYTHICIPFTPHPTPSPLRTHSLTGGSVTSAIMAAGPDAACLGWTNSNPPTPHVLQCLVHVDCIVYVLMLLRCFFPVPRLYSLQEHSLGVAFFSSPLLMSCCIFPKTGADYSSHGSILLPKHIPCV